jgi:hypothetical protein
MPTAGFCSECHSYVWVRSDGRCPHGHDAQHVRDLHDAKLLPGYSEDSDDGAPEAQVAASVPLPTVREEPPVWGAPPAPAFASASAVPTGVPRFNWAAFLNPFFWSLAYRLPELALASIASNGAALYVLTVLKNEQLGSVIVGLALAVQIGIGFLGPRLFWRRNPERLTVKDYNRKQVKWIVIGLVLIGLSFFVPVP